MAQGEAGEGFFSSWLTVYAHQAIYHYSTALIANAIAPAIPKLSTYSLSNYLSIYLDTIFQVLVQVCTILDPLKLMDIDTLFSTILTTNSIHSEYNFTLLR